MEKRKWISVWYDSDADILEVLFEKKEGYFDNADEEGRFLARYDNEGNIIGFMIHGATAVEGGPVNFEIRAKEPEEAGN